MNSKSQEVEIYGKSYTFRGDDAELIKKCSQLVNDRIKQISGNTIGIDLHTIFSVAAMNLAEELIKLQKQQQVLKGEFDSINKLLDTYLENK